MDILGDDVDGVMSMDSESAVQARIDQTKQRERVNKAESRAT